MSFSRAFGMKPQLDIEGEIDGKNTPQTKGSTTSIVLILDAKKKKNLARGGQLDPKKVEQLPLFHRTKLGAQKTSCIGKL